MIPIRVIIEVESEGAIGFMGRVERIRDIVEFLNPIAHQPPAYIMSELAVAAYMTGRFGSWPLYIDSFDGDYGEYRREHSDYDSSIPEITILCSGCMVTWDNDRVVGMFRLNEPNRYILEEQQIA